MEGIVDVCKNKIKSIDTLLRSAGARIKQLTLDLPDRTRIFISALWFWTYVMFYFTKCAHVILGLILEYTPDSIFIHKIKIKSVAAAAIAPEGMLPDISAKSRPDPKPTIIEARHDGDEITNKIKAIINLIWDADINKDSNDQKIFGGLNASDVISIFPKLSTSTIWISYLFEIDKKLSDMDDKELGQNIKHMLVSLSDKAIYRDSDLDQKEKVIFGEIPF
jgi:hypothetical protein